MKKASNSGSKTGKTARSTSASAKSHESRKPASAGSKSTPTFREHSSLPAEAVSKVTADHNQIRRWAEERGGKPACVRGTGGGGDIGMLRIDFPGYSGETSLQPISWDEWFRKFDERGLALLYQEATAGGQKSNFNKIISRETAQEATKPKVRKAGGH